MPQGKRDKQSKMERWRFALPAEFHDHLPSLIQSPQEYEGDGNWRPNVVRDKLRADLYSRKKANNDVLFRIDSGELQLSGKPFVAANLTSWQQRG